MKTESLHLLHQSICLMVKRRGGGGDKISEMK